MKCKKWIALFFLGIIIVFFVCNVSLVTDSVRKYYLEEIRFSEFGNEVQEQLKSDKFSFKELFVDFNGWISRAVGRRIINDVAFVDNGILIDVNQPYVEMGFHGVKLAQFDAALKELNIPFVYIQAPSKIDLERKIIPPGAVNQYNEMADSLLAELETRSVEYMDLRPEFCAKIEDVEKELNTTSKCPSADTYFIFFPPDALC